MSAFNEKSLSGKVRNLARALSQLESEKELEHFLRDLCSPAELEAMGDRWNVALSLEKNNSYRSITESLGASTATISRVARSLKYGKGYVAALKRNSESKGAK